MACDKPPASFGIQNGLWRVKFPIAACVIFLFTAPTQAAWFAARDGLLMLRGAIEMGDAHALATRLKADPGLRVLRLDSYGGSVKGAIELGEIVRRAKLTTLVDASRDVCDSACTMIFAAGVARHYLNAEAMTEGFSGQAGLGYHRSYMRGDRVTPPTLSDEGERLMMAYYRKMGAKAAVALARRGTISSFWRPNGPTALRLGLATSLAAPAPAARGLSPSSPRISGSPARASASSRTSPAN